MSIATPASDLVPIRAAAERLGKSQATVRRWLRQGAPQALPGRRGRAGAALFDPKALAAWRASRLASGTAEQAILEALAAQIPEVCAEAIWRAFTFCEVGLSAGTRRTVAGALAVAWYQSATALRKRIDPGAPEISSTPVQIDRLVRYLEATR